MPAYKKQAEANLNRALTAEQEARRYKEQLDKKAAEDKKRYSATVYCTNCLHVNNVSIPPGVKISEGDCVTCRVRGTQLVVMDYPGKF